MRCKNGKMEQRLQIVTLVVLFLALLFVASDLLVDMQTGISLLEQYARMPYWLRTILSPIFFLLCNRAMMVMVALEQTNERITPAKYDSRYLCLTDFLYSSKIQRELFEPAFSDWQHELAEVEKKNDLTEMYWINATYTSRFIWGIWRGTGALASLRRLLRENKKKREKREING